MRQILISNQILFLCC